VRDAIDQRMEQKTFSSAAGRALWVFLRGESRVVTNVLAIVAGILVAVALIIGWRIMSQSEAESPQNAVLSEAAGLLAEYHRENGYYPETLDDLPFQFAGDGRPETLKLFTYQSDGEHYALVTHSVATGEEMKSCR
jgi:hypothetical protein